MAIRVENFPETNVSELAEQISFRKQNISDAIERLRRHRSGESPLNRADLKTLRREVTRANVLQRKDFATADYTPQYRFRSVAKN